MAGETKQDRYILIQIPGAWSVIDTLPNGWRTLESHADRGRAEQALQRFQGTGSSTAKPSSAPNRKQPTRTPRRPAPRSVRSGRPPVEPSAADLAMARLSELLDNTVRTIKGHISALSADELQQLRRMENDGAGRTSILRAIDQQLRK